MRNREELKFPDKFCINVRGKMYDRLMTFIADTGLRPSAVIWNALEEYLSKRNY